MIKRLTLTILSLLGLAVSVWALQPSVAVYAADPQSEVCQGIDAASDAGDCKSDISLTGVIKNVLRIFSIVIGIVAVIMTMVGGFKYVTAAGDSGNITSAKNTIVYALIGLAVAALSQFFVWFVLDNIK